MTDEIVELEQPPEDESVSMEDTIRETYRALQSEPEEEAKLDRARDEHGRFASKEQEITPATPLPESAPPPVTTRKPPSSWRKEAQELYGKLPQEFQMLQDEVERREADFHKGIESYKSKAQFADAMERVIAPHAQTLQSLGVTPDVAVHHLLEADRVLRYSQPDQKRAYLQQLARSYGIDLQQPEVDQTYQPTDPRVDAVINYLREQETVRQRQEMAQLNSDLAAFARDKPHYEAVRNAMAGLLQVGAAQSLQEAYDMAIYANSEVRAQVLAQQQAQVEEKRKQEAKAQAEAARRAASINVPRRGNLPVQKPMGSMDDTIRETLHNIRSRGL